MTKTSMMWFQRSTQRDPTSLSGSEVALKRIGNYKTREPDFSKGFARNDVGNTNFIQQCSFHNGRVSNIPRVALWRGIAITPEK